MAASLGFIEEAHRILPPKEVPLDGDVPISVLYSDASFEPGRPVKRGWVLVQQGHRTRAGAGVAPAELQSQFVSRKTHIFIGELLAALAALWQCKELVAGACLIHFVDNQGGLASLVNGFCADEDISAVACLYQFLVAALGISVWFEYIESPANLADGPSRDGMDWEHSREATVLGVKMEELILPGLRSLVGAPADFLSKFSSILDDFRLLQVDVAL